MKFQFNLAIDPVARPRDFDALLLTGTRTSIGFSSSFGGWAKLLIWVIVLSMFLEIFHRWLVKAGEIEITEMLLDPEHLLWKESDGRRSFELWRLIVARS